MYLRSVINIQQQIILLLIGGSIGFVSSIGTTLIAELLKNQGKIKLYYKIVFSKAREGETWGFFKNNNDFIFEIPLWIQIQNTSNSVRVVRDLNILLYKNGRKITQMTQITNKDDILYGDDGAYSFVIPPRSLKKYDLDFLIKKKEMRPNHNFDEIKIRYFDEKDNKQIFKINKIKECWNVGNLNRDKSWKLVK